ncbi:DNA cytosine methyltransferase [soil metagenome]
MHKEPIDKLVFLDFFAGAGLVELGMGPEWQCAWANDIDPNKAEVYAANFDPALYHLGDVANICANHLPSGADMAWASFPCQDLSLAGWRRGMSAERSGTFWAFWRIMRDLHDLDSMPPMLVLENVTGLLYGPEFAGLCEALAGLGLRFGAVVIDAKHFVPQSRPRVFLVAVDDRVDTAPFENAQPESSPWLPKSVWSAWLALPPALRARWAWWSLPVPTETVPDVGTRIESRPTTVEWHGAEQTARLLEMMTEVNLARIDQARKGGGRQVGLLYKRTRNGAQRAEIRFDGVAGCLRTPSGGSSRQTVVVVENGTVRSRLLTPREAARLMGVEDSFVLPSSYNQAYKAMGDAVVVPAVGWLSINLLTPLARSLCHRPSAPVAYDVAERQAHRSIAQVRASHWNDARSALAAASEYPGANNSAPSSTR